MTNNTSKHPAPKALNVPRRLSEKYQPQEIADFIGLEKPKRVLANFAAQPYAAAFILEGGSGLGKTTIALALAKAIGAELHHIPSQKCTVDMLDQTIDRCWYVPMNGDSGWHLVLVDEADKMSAAAQLALLSKTDSTEAPPQTIFVFTCNSTAGLEPRFVSRCIRLHFDRNDMNGDFQALLARVWKAEAPRGVPAPDLDEIENYSRGNVRDALMRLETELLAA